jgi:T5orf172 domain
MDFFPAPNSPRIYAYADTNFPDCLKIGFTSRNTAARMAEHYPTQLPTQPYTVHLDEVAMRDDGSFFKDHHVHRTLTRNKVERVNGEWFKCAVEEVQAAILEVKTGRLNEDRRTLNFGMRPEQSAAVDKAIQNALWQNLCNVSTGEAKGLEENFDFDL